MKVIAGMAEGPIAGDTKKLRGGGEDYRRRSGNFRILFRLDRRQRTIYIHRIADRKEVYD